MLSIDLELQAGSPASVAKKSQSFLCPRIQAITLMLEPPPRTLPMFIGMARPFRTRLRPKVPVPFGPEIEEPLPGVVHAGHVVFATGLDQENADLRVLRQPPCHDGPRR